MNPIPAFLIALQRFWAAVREFENQLQTKIKFPACDPHPLQKALTADLNRWETKLQALSATERRNPYGFREDKLKALHLMEKIADALEALEVYRRAPLNVLLPNDRAQIERSPSTQAMSSAMTHLETGIVRLRTKLGMGPRIKSQKRPQAPEMEVAGASAALTSSTENPKMRRDREAVGRSTNEFIAGMLAFRIAYQQFLEQGPKPDDSVFKASWQTEMLKLARDFDHDIRDWQAKLLKAREDICREIYSTEYISFPEKRVVYQFEICSLV